MSYSDAEIIERTLAVLEGNQQLAYENFQFIMLTQASLGKTSFFHAITMECSGASVHIDFFAREESEAMREAIEDIEVDFLSYQSASVPLTKSVFIGLPPRDYGKRAVFWDLNEIAPGDFAPKLDNSTPSDD